MMQSQVSQVRETDIVTRCVVFEAGSSSRRSGCRFASSAFLHLVSYGPKPSVQAPQPLCVCSSCSLTFLPLSLTLFSSPFTLPVPRALLALLALPTSFVTCCNGSSSDYRASLCSSHTLSTLLGSRDHLSHSIAYPFAGAHGHDHACVLAVALACAAALAYVSRQGRIAAYPTASASQER